MPHKQIHLVPKETVLLAFGHPQPTQGPIKPPQLEMTPFEGDVLKWQEFWDQFEASIHKANYPPIDKFNYLRSKLKGEALSAISIVK